MMFERLIVVTKPTPLEDLLERRPSKSQAAFYLKSRGGSIAEYEAAHAAIRKGVETVLAALPRDVPHTVITRSEIPSFLFRLTDLVIAIGPDGLVANVAKYLDAQPILAVNPDPTRIDGVLMRFAPDSVALRIRKLLEGSARADLLTLAEATTNDGQRLLAVNDFMIGRRDHVSARYSIEFNGSRERHSSSGVLVSTGVGSSGWMSSVVNGVYAIASEFDAPEAPEKREVAGGTVPFDWSDRRLLFVVREPFASRATGVSTVCNWIEEGETLTLHSEMGEGGAIFSDGVPEDALEFNAGTTVTIRVASTSANLLV